MGISIDMYRVAIGLFHGRITTSYRGGIIYLFRPQVRAIFALIAFLSDFMFSNKGFVLFLSNALLNQHGDVESNPGPSSFGEANSFLSDKTDSINSYGFFNLFI